MTAPAILAARMEFAHRKAMEVIEEHGAPERIENLQAITVGQATASKPYHIASFMAEIVASLAEIVDGQERRIAEQDRRITELENAAQPAKAEAPTTKAKKDAKKS